MLRLCRARILGVLLLLAAVPAVQAQSTSFTYQGRLTDGGTAASGNYDLQFVLFDSLSSGTQIGSTQTVNAVPVSDGVFTVTLDFGAGSFNGSSRFLEIRVRPAGGSGFTILEPRQPVTSTPYAVRSLSAAAADNVPVNGVPAGSANYIQNTTSAQSANFDITGNGTVGGNLAVTGGAGIGTSTFFRPHSLQIGAGPDAAFTVSPSDGTPNAGYVRFGDSTGWKLHFARSRESSGAPLNTGTTGALMTIQDNGNVGIGDTAPAFRLHVVDSANTGLRVQTNTGGGTVASFGGNGDFQIDKVNVVGGRLTVKENGNVGINNPAPKYKLDVLGDARVDNGQLIAPNLAEVAQGVAPMDPLCFWQGSAAAPFGTFIRCPTSSSLRYKSNVTPFIGGLDLVNHLRPIAFTWKGSGAKDIGLGAEDVERVAPIFTFKNEKGEIEGVRYDRLAVIFVNAIKEQEAELQRQQELLSQQQQQIASLSAQIRMMEKALRRSSKHPQ